MNKLRATTTRLVVHGFLPLDPLLSDVVMIVDVSLRVVAVPSEVVRALGEVVPTVALLPVEVTMSLSSVVV